MYQLQTRQDSEAYNPALRSVTATEPDPAVSANPNPTGVTFDFDKVGNLTDASGNFTNFGDDCLNRRITKTDPFDKVLKSTAR